jgi:hypothetical protein
VKSLEHGCFQECYSLSKVTFESGIQLKEISFGAFFHSSVEKIEIPKSVIELCECCFSGCSQLVEVKFESGSNLNSIGKSAFYGARLPTVTIPASTEELLSRCFGECKSLQEVKFESGSRLSKIGENVFVDSKISKLELPNSVVEVDGTLFRQIEKVILPKNGKFIVDKDYIFSASELIGCTCFFSDGEELDLSSLMRKHSVRVLGPGVFVKAKLEKVVIPNCVTQIGDHCFATVSLHEVVFERGSNLKIIDDGAFSHTTIQRIEIPASVEEIEAYCFANCDSLNEIIFEADSCLQTVGATVLSKKIKTLTIHPPQNRHNISIIKQAFKRVVENIVEH